jgi:hypothetical protein
MSTTARWNLVVSKQTDQSLHEHLAHEGLARKGELSRFVEEAVRNRIFEQAAERAKQENSIYPQSYIEDAIEEALEWARRTK